MMANEPSSLAYTKTDVVLAILFGPEGVAWGRLRVRLAHPPACECSP